jgi:hypothetical protein
MSSRDLRQTLGEVHPFQEMQELVQNINGLFDNIEKPLLSPRSADTEFIAFLSEPRHRPSMTSF